MLSSSTAVVSPAEGHRQLFQRAAKPGVLVFCVLLLAAHVEATPPQCAGDCNGDGEVTVDEVITGVNIGLGLTSVEACIALDVDASGDVTVDELVTAITNALDGCPRPLPTATTSATATAADTATPTATVTLSATPSATSTLALTATPTLTPSTTTTMPPTSSATPTHTASRTPTMIPSATPTMTSTATEAPTSTATVSPSATPTATTPPDIPTPEPVPTIGSALRVWLQEGNYLDWTAESAPHPSTGPHFGIVRTYFNPTVFASLQAGLPSHPQGSALVKELYGQGDVVRGWSVMVKVQDDSDGGNGWYWYERFGDSTFANGTGEPGCTVCHALGNDYVRAPFPLQ